MAPGFRSFAGLAVASVILCRLRRRRCLRRRRAERGRGCCREQGAGGHGRLLHVGEGGRRASNGWTVSESEEAPDRQAGDYGNVTVGDFGVYDQAPQVGPKNDWCHRTASSPGNIGGDWTIINLACSGP